MSRVCMRMVTVLSVVALVAGSALAERKERPARPKGGERSEDMKRPGGERQGPGAGRFLERMLESDVAKEIGLDEAQVKTLQDGLENLKTQEEGLREKLAAAGKTQAELMMAEGELDEAELMKAVEATGRIRTEMAKLRVQPILLVKKTLTAEQLKKVHEHMRTSRDARREKMEGRREKMDGMREKREARRKEQQEHRKQERDQEEDDEGDDSDAEAPDDL